jgi:hypothetical protein
MRQKAARSVGRPPAEPGFAAGSLGDNERQPRWKGDEVAVERDRGIVGGITLGGILVIVGIVVALLWSVWLGIIIALIGLIAFGGFVRGKWY